MLSLSIYPAAAASWGSWSKADKEQARQQMIAAKSIERFKPAVVLTRSWARRLRSFG